MSPPVALKMVGHTGGYGKVTGSQGLRHWLGPRSWSRGSNGRGWSQALPGYDGYLPGLKTAGKSLRRALGVLLPRGRGLGPLWRWSGGKGHLLLLQPHPVWLGSNGALSGPGSQSACALRLLSRA